MSIKPKVALSQDFLLNLAKLPAAVQGKVLKWAIRFQTDPTASGFNYETIRAARDVQLKSMRIDGTGGALSSCRPGATSMCCWTSITMTRLIAGRRTVS